MTTFPSPSEIAAHYAQTFDFLDWAEQAIRTAESVNDSKVLRDLAIDASQRVEGLQLPPVAFERLRAHAYQAIKPHLVETPDDWTVDAVKSVGNQIQAWIEAMYSIQLQDELAEQGVPASFFWNYVGNPPLDQRFEEFFQKIRPLIADEEALLSKYIDEILERDSKASTVVAPDLKELTKTERLAYLAYEQVNRQASRQLTLKEAHTAILALEEDEANGYRPQSLDAWRRAFNRAKKKLGGPKNSRAVNTISRSVIRISETN
jgi:hypothetical protein